jgi:polysaccharide pyruvyl transferase WcaK-like protein
MIRVLMVGYNGANNTGAEALLLSDIEDVREVLGSQAHITVPTLNEANLRRYLAEGPTLRIAPMPTLFFASIRRMVRESDLVLLVEGSTYMDTWGSPLLWAFLWATHCAAEMGKPCLSYAVDAGTLKPANARRARRVASRTDLIVTRNHAAAGLLRLGRSPILSTADNAFTFPASKPNGVAPARGGPPAVEAWLRTPPLPAVINWA